MVDGGGQEQPEQLYYILDARSVVGNCALWWAPDGRGYVCDLRQAGKYPRGAERSTDIFIPCDVAEAAVVHHVRQDAPAIAELVMAATKKSAPVVAETTRSRRRG